MVSLSCPCGEEVLVRVLRPYDFVLGASIGKGFSDDVVLEVKIGLQLSHFARVSIFEVTADPLAFERYLDLDTLFETVFCFVNTEDRVTEDGCESTGTGMWRDRRCFRCRVGSEA